jgi:isocitrate dehydrogenase kinase/phosphatase
MPFRRGRFVDLVERQLELFERENSELVEDTEAALRAYDRAERDEAEARYETYRDLAETGQDELVEIRDTYARTLDDETAEEYCEVFNRLVRKRLPRFGLELD